MRHLPLLLPLLAPLATAAKPSVPATRASSSALPSSGSATPQDELGDLKEVLDPSLRWLRAQQDRTSGAYGDVEQTAWTS